MNNLTLNEIAGYYPHKVKMYVYDDIDGCYFPETIVGLNLNGYDTEWGNYDFSETDKLLLRPLSDLTKTIQVEGYNNGEPFVPIIELAKLFYDSSNSTYKTTSFENPRETETHYLVNCCVENDSSRYIYYMIPKDLSKAENRVIELFNRWHIDYRTLIGQGKAINLNEVK